jgi:hypothetical protein
MRRYIRDKTNGNVLVSMEEMELPVENATEFLTSRNLSPSDFEIGLASEEKLDQWIAEQAEQAKTYSDHRATEYPHITDQLDMLYWDKINETEIWKNSITKIKEKFPKE